MALSEYLSKHLPGLASGVVSVTGSATIQTGLREVKSCTANIKGAGVAANEESVVTPDWGGSLNPGEVTLTVEKGGTNHGTAGDSAVDVVFHAYGDR